MDCRDCISYFTKEQLREFVSSFAQIDKDLDGKLTPYELKRAFKKH